MQAARASPRARDPRPVLPLPWTLELEAADLAVLVGDGRAPGALATPSRCRCSCGERTTGTRPVRCPPWSSASATTSAPTGSAGSSTRRRRARRMRSRRTGGCGSSIASSGRRRSTGARARRAGRGHPAPRPPQPRLRGARRATRVYRTSSRRTRCRGSPFTFVAVMRSAALARVGALVAGDPDAGGRRGARNEPLLHGGKGAGRRAPAPAAHAAARARRRSSRSTSSSGTARESTARRRRGDSRSAADEPRGLPRVRPSCACRLPIRRQRPASGESAGEQAGRAAAARRGSRPSPAG